MYELPENMEKSPKNFKPLDVPQVAEVKPEETEAVTATTEAEKGFTLSRAEGFKCKVCGKVCKSEFGLKRHQRMHK